MVCIPCLNRGLLRIESTRDRFGGRALSCSLQKKLPPQKKAAPKKKLPPKKRAARLHRAALRFYTDILETAWPSLLFNVLSRQGQIPSPGLIHVTSPRFSLGTSIVGPARYAGARDRERRRGSLRLIDSRLVGCLPQFIESSRLQLANSLLRHTHCLAYLFQG